LPKIQSTHAIGFSRILGLRDAVALGLSLGVPLVLVVMHEAVFAAVGRGAPLAYALAIPLYLPLILSYMELAAGRPGSASPFQLAGSFQYSGLAFSVGWLMLAGLVSVAALLALAVAERLALWLDHLFAVDVGHVWLLAAVVFLASVHEGLSDVDRWRMRTAIVVLALALTVGILVWGYVAHPPGGELRDSRLFGHDLSAVALLAAGLWSIDLLLNHRRQMRRPDATLKHASLAVWITTGVLSVATTALAVRTPEIWMADWSEKLSWGETRLQLLGLVVSTTFCWMGLSRVVSRTVRLTGTLSHDGFLPRIGKEGQLRRTRALVTLSSLAAALVIVAWWVPGGLLMTLAAMTFLWVTVLVMVPYARRPARDLDPVRRNRLPLHPLFPGYSAAVAVFLSWVLPLRVSAIGLGWLALGGVYYYFFARKAHTEVKQDKAVVGVGIEESKKERPRVMIGTEDDQQLPALLKSGAALAKACDGELMVLRVLPLTDELSLHGAQRSAQAEWASLERQMQPHLDAAVEIQTVVRIAPSVETGIVATANEFDADVVVMAAPGEPVADASTSAAARVFSVTSRPLAILKGDYPDMGAKVTVATGGGPHAVEGLELGARLAAGLGGDLELVSVSVYSRSDEEAEIAIQRTLDAAQSGTDVPTRVIEAKSIETGLEKEGDLLIIGSSIDRLLSQTVFGGLPLEVARARGSATLVVKRAEAAMHFWKRRLWEMLNRILPTLPVKERSDVYSQMAEAARADVDFYALISLSSGIALFGLLLDSSAVIIGAMLVAPLMSPILSLAQGIVQGNPHLIQRAGASTFKGTAVSIGVSTVLTLLLPVAQPTGEILARVRPNLLDLGVALAAGAAAAYAVSRKSVAAALPGVAISVALVPPLCVVGFGLGTSKFDIAGGALLLFLTNLGGIVLVGVVVFLMMGFRPTRAERGVRARQATLFAVVGLVLVALPLGVTTVNIARERNLRTQINKTLGELNAGAFGINRYSIEKEQGQFVVVGTIYAYQDIRREQVEMVQKRLSDAAGVPVKLRVTIVPATLTEVGGASKERSGEGPVVPFVDVDGLSEPVGEEVIEADPLEPTGD
jgi:uncharacterized hydrophobic protein (TIGR00271 family)